VDVSPRATLVDKGNRNEPGSPTTVTNTRKTNMLGIAAIVLVSAQDIFFQDPRLNYNMVGLPEISRTGDPNGTARITFSETSTIRKLHG